MGRRCLLLFWGLDEVGVVLDESYFCIRLQVVVWLIYTSRGRRRSMISLSFYS